MASRCQDVLAYYQQTDCMEYSYHLFSGREIEREAFGADWESNKAQPLTSFFFLFFFTFVGFLMGRHVNTAHLISIKALDR